MNWFWNSELFFKYRVVEEIIKKKIDLYKIIEFLYVKIL